MYANIVLLACMSRCLACNSMQYPLVGVEADQTVK
jgi:hypothetical protein